jgi:SAM-dependent MidA family methyltransferase
MPTVQADGGAGTLLARLAERIRRDGPMPVDRYMQACLDDPEHGFWQRANTIGAGGDFITAPEISQVFGELIGLWCAVAWEGMGRPALLNLVELGPGRGTLMADALRAARAAPGFIGRCRSSRRSERRVAGDAEERWWRAGSLRHWRRACARYGAAIVIASRFLDALPIRQLDSAGVARARRRRRPQGGLRFGGWTGGGFRHRAPLRPGAIVDYAPARPELLAALAEPGAPLAARS